MKSYLVISLLLASLLQGANIPTLELQRVELITGEIPAALRVSLKLVNDTDRPYYFLGHGPTGLFAGLELKKNRAWIPQPGGVCGVGIGQQVIRPKSSIVFLAFVGPDEISAEPVRFRFTCYEDAAHQKEIAVCSKEFVPSKSAKPVKKPGR
ncbi:MAG TPA: hypothetical protein VHO24_17190 [Opitutaceae bacterium]|nr:hypothetical protein [Opitutaceae bacterium]